MVFHPNNLARPDYLELFEGGSRTASNETPGLPPCTISTRGCAKRESRQRSTSRRTAGRSRTSSLGGSPALRLVDAKYRSLSYVRHQFVDNLFGWSVNIFALAEGRAVGHCGVIPFRARRGAEPFIAGKLEALAVDGRHRGRRADDGGSLATDILSRCIRSP